MSEAEQSGSIIESADVHVCAFPNIDRLLVVDVRDERSPAMRVVKAEELMTPDYYKEVEEAFSKILRAGGNGFLKVMALPMALQVVLQEKGMAAIQRLFPGPGKHGDIRISVIIAESALLTMSEEDLLLANEAFFDGKYADDFVASCGKAFAHLVAKERAAMAEKEKQELRDIVTGGSDQFYTVWERKPGGES
jgi:hypothetical protein